MKNEFDKWRDAVIISLICIVALETVFNRQIDQLQSNIASGLIKNDTKILLYLQRDDNVTSRIIDVMNEEVNVLKEHGIRLNEVESKLGI